MNFSIIDQEIITMYVVAEGTDHDRKIFGKKSTGIVYMICTGFLLISFAFAAAAYFLWKKGSLLTLIGFAVFTVFEIALMSLPVFVQKKFRIYIPPAVEICICLSSVLFLIARMYPARTDRLSMLVPLFTGFTVAMTVFCILHSLSDSEKSIFAGFLLSASQF